VTPPILNQEFWGTCWAFAATEVMESYLMTQGITMPDGEPCNFSRLHLAYFAYSTYEFGGITLPAFTRRIPWLGNDEDPQNPIFDNGGFPERVVALLSRGTGPVLERDAPYPEIDSSTEDPEDFWSSYIPTAPYGLKNQFRLSKAPMYPYFKDDEAEKTQAEAIKNALMTKGGLYIEFYAGEPESQWNYFSQGEDPNHAVMLVGWDDDYDKKISGPITTRIATITTSTRKLMPRVKTAHGGYRTAGAREPMVSPSGRTDSIGSPTRTSRSCMTLLRWAWN
jgi:C1A family cysteine protease